MSQHLRHAPIYSARALGSSLLWGAIEFVALCRSRWAGRAAGRRSRGA